METLDTPIALHYKKGKTFPSNAVILGFLLIAVSIPAFFGNIFIAIGAFIFGMLMAFTNYGCEIDVERRTIKEYTKLFGFNKIGKDVDYKNYQFVTVVPAKQTNTTYGRGTMSTSSTDYLFAIVLLNSNYRNKKELVRFKQKSKCEDTARGLAFEMKLEYFDYYPQVVRQKLSRQ